MLAFFLKVLGAALGYVGFSTMSIEPFNSWLAKSQATQ